MSHLRRGAVILDRCRWIWPPLLAVAPASMAPGIKDRPVHYPAPRSHPPAKPEGQRWTCSREPMPIRRSRESRPHTARIEAPEANACV